MSDGSRKKRHDDRREQAPSLRAGAEYLARKRYIRDRFRNTVVRKTVGVEWWNCNRGDGPVRARPYYISLIEARPGRKLPLLRRGFDGYFCAQRELFQRRRVGLSIGHERPGALERSPVLLVCAIQFVRRHQHEDMGSLPDDAFLQIGLLRASLAQAATGDDAVGPKKRLVY